jgi:Uma2 family endonuclease
MSEQIELPLGPMAVETFLAWVDQQPMGRFELQDGHVFAMAPGTIAHARAKLAATLALRNAIAAAGAPCEAFVDGVGIRISDDTLYIPDASVQYGERAGPDLRALPTPMVVVEVTSHSTSRVDYGSKFVDYLRQPTIRHYLQVLLDRRVVLHHSRDAEAEITTRIVPSGELRLDPPRLTIRIEDLFES